MKDGMDRSGAGSAACRSRLTTHGLWTCVPSCLLLVFLLTSFASAKIQVNVEDWGLGGAVKAGAWSPLYVQMTSAGEDFEGAIEVEADGAQQVTPVFVKPIRLVRDTPTQHWLYFRAPAAVWRGSFARFTWRVRNARGDTVFQSEWARPQTLPSGDSVVAIVRSADIAGAGLGGLLDQQSEVRINPLLVSTGWLPDRRVGYESADALVWINPNPALLAGESQREALSEHVRSGGHLVLAAGSGWPALAQSFLAEFLPAAPAGSELVPDLPALAAYGMTASERKIVLMRMSDVKGTVVMRHGDAPVIVRGRYGAGTVTLIGFDPTAAPFNTLSDRGRFWAEVLRLDAARRERNKVGSMQGVSGPLIGALSEFPGFKPINFGLVAAFLLVYIVLIGPVDYFVLKRLRKLHWTWITFPCVAVLSSVFAFWSLSSGRVTGLYANSLSIVDATPDGMATGTTYMTMLSPSHADYNARLDGPALRHGSGQAGALTPREYQAVPGAAPGGGLTSSKCLVLGAGLEVRDLTVRIWDAQTFEASWSGTLSSVPEARLAMEKGRLTGVVTNGSAAAMEAAIVLCHGKAYFLGDLAPGAKASLSGGVQDIPAYAAAVVPRGFAQGHLGGWGRPATDRGEAVAAARWISVFAWSGHTAKDGTFRRWADTAQEYRSAVFDLPARLQLTGLDSPDHAVLLYAADTSREPPVRVVLENQRPVVWDRTVMRVHIPVKSAE